MFFYSRIASCLAPYLTMVKNIFTSYFTIIKAISICCLFMTVGPMLILLNKYIMHDVGFPYPIFLSGLGVVASGLCAQALVDLGYIAIENEDASKNTHFYSRILPIALSSAGKWVIF